MNGVTPILDFYIRPRIFAKKGWYYNEDNPPTQETSETEVEA
jgi:hypothetical protein